MSGICGIVAFEDREPTLGPILDQLERRGPDATRSWREGPLALGHTLLATTPEALIEILPLTDEASGCTITADVRIDNRDELIAALGLADETRTIGDGELILRAYLLWGEECPRHLLGDFAFAIWDPRHQRLFCARDHMGMRQLIYHHAPGRLFAFATEAEALVAHADVPKRINEGRIADFLDDLEGIDLTSTFFEEAFRLPPAHVLTIDADGLAMHRYWVLEPGPALKLYNDQAYADAFLAVFTEAVRCRLRGAGPIGSMLSGGVDSGAVVAVASRLLAETGSGPLQTVSAIGPDPGSCAETRAIRASMTMAGIAPNLVNHAELGPYRDDLIRLTTAIAEPFDGHMTLVRAVYIAAHRAGIKVMLDGASGDVTLTASNQVADHLRNLRWRAALCEARGEARFWKVPRYGLRSLAAAAWVTWVPIPIRDARRNFIQHFQTRNPGQRGAISRQFAEIIDRRARWRRFQSHVVTENLPDAQRRAESIRHPHLTVGRERYDRVAAARAIEPRDPFLDIRVLQFCLSLPADQLQRDGWPKVILRQAMARQLPDEVIWRRGKEHLGWSFTQSLIGSWPGWRKSLNAAMPALSRYVALSRPFWRNPTATSEHEKAIELYFLSLWMERNMPIDS